MKEDINNKLNAMLSAAFRQGMAAQRNEDAQHAMREAQSEMQEEAQNVMSSVQDFYKLFNLDEEEKQEVN